GPATQRGRGDALRLHFVLGLDGRGPALRGGRRRAGPLLPGRPRVSPGARAHRDALRGAGAVTGGGQSSTGDGLRASAGTGARKPGFPSSVYLNDRVVWYARSMSWQAANSVRMSSQIACSVPR